MPGAGSLRRVKHRWGVLGLLMAASSGCYALFPARGGGQTDFVPPRYVRPADVALPQGYGIEPVVTGLTFPSGVAFDERGAAYVLEAGYAYGEEFDTPRLLRVEPDGRTTVIATGENPPWNGVAYHQGFFYVAEGGVLEGGRILRISPDGSVTTLLEGLPSMGDHHTNGPAIGPDGWLYFSQGVVTNSGVVGLDNHDFGWLERFPDLHDIPCEDVTLAGRNYTTRNPLTPGREDRATTGAFVPFGTPTTPGQVVRGRVPCSGAIMRIPLSGGEPELVAWGLRNPFGLAWSAEGRLYVTDNSYDARGSRPVFGTGDLVWQINPGTWYGWPDYYADRPLTDANWFQPPGGPVPGFLLSRHPNVPPRPSALLGVHSSSNAFDFSRNPAFGHVGEAFIPQFGDMSPGSGKVTSPVGFKVVRVNVGEGTVEDFAVNRGPTNGPASRVGGGGLERPVAARFDPAGTGLYVVDFGVMTVDQERPWPLRQTGVLWRITSRPAQAR
jgi:glucose/arabinose dehydrogenase